MDGQDSQVARPELPVAATVSAAPDIRAPGSRSAWTSSRALTELVRYSVLLAVCSLALACGSTFETRSAGIDYVTDVGALRPFDLVPRCRPGDSSCSDRALQLAEPILRSLGDPYDGPGIADTSGSPADGSLPLVFHRDPAVQWTSPTGAGLTNRFAIDVGPYLLGSGVPFAVVDSSDGTIRFSLISRVADELISALYLDGSGL